MIRPLAADGWRVVLKTVGQERARESHHQPSLGVKHADCIDLSALLESVCRLSKSFLLVAESQGGGDRASASTRA